MTNTIKTMFALVSITLATIALAGCGGGDDKDSSKGGTTDSGGSGAVSEQGAAYRVVDQFVNYMANGEYGQARELTDNGGAASILDKYVEMADINNANQNLASINDVVFRDVTERFASVNLEVVEQGDTSGTVRMNIGDESHDITVNSIDGTTWTIALPQNVLVPLEELMGNVQEQLPPQP